MTAPKELLGQLIGGIGGTARRFADVVTWTGAHTFESAITASGGVTGNLTGNVTGDVAGDVTPTMFILSPTEATVATGVLTVTSSFVNVLPETSTADQVDSIVYTGATEGTVLVLISKATNTITIDDANINLGAATRAVAPGGSITLYYDGTEWTELTFLAGADNVT